MDERLTARIYGVPEVAHLAGIPRPRVRRWLFGYAYKGGDGKERQSQPLVTTTGDDQGVSFSDLMELIYANAFMGHGFSIHRVRRALEEARRITGLVHPFAMRTVYVGPTDIYLQSQDDAEELRSLLERGQQAIAPVIHEISKRLDFDEEGNAIAWHPLGRRAPVVVDPYHCFGAPRISGTRIPTSTIAGLWRRFECDTALVAKEYEIPPEQVLAAVEFENARRQAA